MLLSFSRITWGFIKRFLQKCAISRWLLSTIMSLHSCPPARVLTSGMLSEGLYITNGTRQWCPLSPKIFTLIVEPLAEWIRNNLSISGITLHKTAHKRCLYVDSCTTPIWLDISSFSNILILFDLTYLLIQLLFLKRSSTPILFF